MHIHFRAFLNIPFLALAAFPAGDQTTGVSGTVFDPSGRPIRGALIECAGRTLSTGLDGRFEAPDIPRCRADVSAPGFETQKVELVSGAPARVALVIAGVTERIVVTATRHETTMEEAGVAASVITGADLALREFPAIYETLREMPGVHVSTTGRQGSLTSIYTRGAQRTGMMVLIDGMPVNDPGGEFNFAHLTSGSIERVELVRGPESALFGAEASAGVVQLFTRRGAPEQVVPRGSLSYERGGFQTDRWIARLAGGSGRRFDYSLHAEQLHTAGEFPNDYYRNTAGTANAGFRIGPNTQFRGVLRTGDAITGVPGQVGFGLADRDAFETNRDSTLSLRLDDARGGRYLQRVFFGHHRVSDLYTDSRMDGPYRLAALVRDVQMPQRRTYLLRLLDPGRLPAVIPPGTRLVTADVLLYPLFDPFLSATSRTRAGYQGTWEGGGDPLVFGYDYERQAGDVSARDVRRNNHGVFVHKQQTLAQRLTLSGGMRFERSVVFGNKVTPRGAASLLLLGERGPLSSTFLRFGAGRGITEPSLLQNFARESYFTGNPDLRPEKTASFETGLVQELFGRRARTEVTVFHNSFRDLITFVSLPPPVWGSWRNVDKSRARGLELSGRVRVAKHVTFNGAYTRLWTRIIHSNAPNHPFTGIGQELGRRPAHSGAVSLSAAPRRWWFQAGAFLVGERQDYDYNLGVTRNTGYQNVYAAASLRLSGRFIPFVRADNLLNARYQEVLGYSNRARGVYGGIRVEW